MSEPTEKNPEKEEINYVPASLLIAISIVLPIALFAVTWLDHAYPKEWWLTAAEVTAVSLCAWIGVVIAAYALQWLTRKKQ